jgi:HEPN domain-containing protein
LDEPNCFKVVEWPDPVRYTRSMGGDSGSNDLRKGVTSRTAAMATQYWSFANDELSAARLLLSPNHYFAAVQHAHQAAEKALKAACWHLRAEEPPHVHDLAVLEELLVDEVEAIPEAVRSGSERLDPLYGVSRYPSSRVADPRPSEAITEQQARAAIEAAEQVMTWVEELLRRAPGRPRRGKRS